MKSLLSTAESKVVEDSAILLIVGSVKVLLYTTDRVNEPFK